MKAGRNRRLKGPRPSVNTMNRRLIELGVKRPGKPLRFTIAKPTGKQKKPNSGEPRLTQANAANLNMPTGVEWRSMVWKANVLNLLKEKGFSVDEAGNIVKTGQRSPIKDPKNKKFFTNKRFSVLLTGKNK